MKYLIAAVLIAFATACSMNDTRDALPEPRAGFVTDMPAFEGFLAEHRPTPEQLRQVYPDILVVLPGEIATKELRMDNSRFFAQLDDEGRIVGGRFQ